MITTALNKYPRSYTQIHSYLTLHTVSLLPLDKTMTQPSESYQYDDLPTQTSFRVLELLPGQEGDHVSCLLHIVEWPSHLKYEAISYSWGDPHVKEPVICHGKRLEVTRNLHSGLIHLRLKDKSRILWADAIW